MGLGLGDRRQNAAVRRHPARSRASAAAPPTTVAAYRSPYRVDGDGLYLVDQRSLPDVLEEQTLPSRVGRRVLYPRRRRHAVARSWRSSLRTAWP